MELLEGVMFFSIADECEKLLEQDIDWAMKRPNTGCYRKEEFGLADTSQSQRVESDKDLGDVYEPTCGGTHYFRNSW